MESLTTFELAEVYFLAAAAVDTQFQYWVSVTFAVVVASFVAGGWLDRRVRVIAAILYLVTTGVLVTLHAVYGQTLVGALIMLQETDAASLFPTVQYLGVTRTAMYLIGTAAAVWFLLRKSAKTPEND